MSTIILPIIHFNDVYNMTTSADNKVMRDGKLTNKNFARVVRFSDKINEIRAQWDKDARENCDPNLNEQEIAENGLVLFSGDLFSPSVESMLTKGRNMVHLMNELSPDACVPGNHEFDFGRERFNQLTEFSNFNWILSNVKEYPKNPETGKIESNKQGEILRGLREYCVFKRGGLRIGVIGLMSDDTINATLASAKENLKAEPNNMKDTCLRLSRQLRKPKKEGGEGCDLILALTHAKHHEDIALGRELNAYPSNKLDKLEDLDGVDAIFGGHDHDYFLGRGVEFNYGGANVTSENNKKNEKLENGSADSVPKNGEEGDNGLLIVKSGYDFHDLSEVKIVLEEKPNGMCRRYVIKSLTVTRHHLTHSEVSMNGDQKSSMENVLRRQFQNEVRKALDTPVVSLSEPLNFSSLDPRKYETRIEECTARDIIALLPFPSPLVALSLRGQAIIDALEGALSNSGTGVQAPAGSNPGEGSGQFPVFSGIHVEWDSTKPKDSRVQRVLVPRLQWDGDEWEPIKPDNIYCVLTNSYLADGNIGFDSFKTNLRRSNCDIPMFQALQSYLDTVYSLEQLDDLYQAVVDHVKEKKSLPPDFPLKIDTVQRLERVWEVAVEMRSAVEVIRKEGKPGLEKLRTSIKRSASTLFDLTQDSYVPSLKIGQTDGRMVDVSKKA